jgi:hypothetical protein
MQPAHPDSSDVRSHPIEVLTLLVRRAGERVLVNLILRRLVGGVSISYTPIVCQIAVLSQLGWTWFFFHLSASTYKLKSNGNTPRAKRHVILALLDIPGHAGCIIYQSGFRVSGLLRTATTHLLTRFGTCLRSIAYSRIHCPCHGVSCRSTFRHLDTLPTWLGYTCT